MTDDIDTVRQLEVLLDILDDEYGNERALDRSEADVSDAQRQFAAGVDRGIDIARQQIKQTIQAIDEEHEHDG